MKRRLRTLALALGLALVLTAGTAAAKGKVCAVLVLDTNSKDLAPALKEDAKMVRQFLEGGIGKEFLEVSEVTGDQVTLGGLRDHLKGLPLTGDDALVCFVGCHGCTDQDSRRHVFQFSGGGNKHFVWRDDVRRELEAKQARLTVLLSESCSDLIVVAPGGGRRKISVFGRLSHDPKKAGKVLGAFGAIGRSQVRPCFRKLFLDTRGLVDVNGSFEGTYAWFTPDRGGVFTRALYQTFLKAQDQEPAGWADFYGDVKEQTQDTFKNWRKAVLDEFEPKLSTLEPQDQQHLKALKEQPEQTTQAFFLSGTRLKLITEEKEGVGVVVTDLPLDSPARAAGVRIQDVIMRVNGRPVRTADDWRDVVGQALVVPNPSLTFEILRGRGTTEVTVKVPGR